MYGITERLLHLLNEAGVDYRVIHHQTDVRATDTAADTDTSPQSFAKTVCLCIDGAFALAVLPAAHYVSERRLREAIGADEVRLATEEEYARVCPDSELGAAPPFGNLYGLPIYASPALTRSEQITFNGGSHDCAVRLAYRDFNRLAEPRVVKFSKQAPVEDS